MKKSISKRNTLTLLFLLVCCISCQDDLEIKANETITEADFLNNSGNANQLLNSVYNKMLDYECYSFSWIGITSITSDDADKGSSLATTTNANGNNNSDKYTHV